MPIRPHAVPVGPIMHLTTSCCAGIHYFHGKLFLRGVSMGGLGACGFAMRYADVITWHIEVVKVDPAQILIFTSTPAILSSQTSACLSAHVCLFFCLSGSCLFCLPLCLHLSFPLYPSFTQRGKLPVGGGEQPSSAHAPIYRQQTLGKR